MGEEKGAQDQPLCRPPRGEGGAKETVCTVAAQCQNFTATQAIDRGRRESLVPDPILIRRACREAHWTLLALHSTDSASTDPACTAEHNVHLKHSC